jgi:hypothetical protein
MVLTSGVSGLRIGMDSFPTGGDPENLMAGWVEIPLSGEQSRALKR